MDGKPTVTDGPFAKSKEAIGGYWIIQVRSREKAIERAKRAPMSNTDQIEVRGGKGCSGSSQHTRPIDHVVPSTVS